MAGEIFTNSEFLRLQAQVEQLLKINKELKGELAFWKPTVEISASPEIEAVTYVCRYSKEGFQQVITNYALATAEAETLDHYVMELGSKSAALRTKAIAKMIRPTIQKAADYAKSTLKVKANAST